MPLGVWTPRAAPSPLPRPARNSCALSRNRRESLTAMSRWPISLARDAPRPRSGSTGRRPRDGHGGHACLDIAGAVGRCRNPQRARQCRRSRRRPRARARRHALGSDLRRRRQPRRHGRGRRARSHAPDPRVRCLRRIGRRGPGRRLHRGHARLVARAPSPSWTRDLQHDETLLPRMLEAVRRAPISSSPRASARAASRGDGPLAGASVGQPGRQRGAAVLLGERLSDPMSGFFMIRREPSKRWRPGFRRRASSCCSISSSRRGSRLRSSSCPSASGARQHGDSKLDGIVAMD